MESYRTVEVEEGIQRSTRSVTFIFPLELDCEETEAIPETGERNTDAEEEGNLEELTQLAILSDEENGEEIGSADQQPALDESSHSPSIEGGSLQHSGTPPEPTQMPSSESDIEEEAYAESPNQETLKSDATTRPPRRAAQWQRQLLRDLIGRDLI